MVASYFEVNLKSLEFKNSALLRLKLDQPRTVFQIVLTFCTVSIHTSHKQFAISSNIQSENSYTVVSVKAYLSTS